uniref:Pleckstrin homology domain-containing family S member 1 isoform X2 n=1 Tax=Geotrypetes seraphini TaxID=260995 RepID=A0A6P8RC67_GEOSA|nr:pleckstrin homology domain-containing family S member 1 isoform X2 [Geotrypetes seraphini]
MRLPKENSLKALCLWQSLHLENFLIPELVFKPEQRNSDTVSLSSLEVKRTAGSSSSLLGGAEKLTLSSSWKKRLFILTKSKQNTYALHYYKIQHSEKRGLIEISQIVAIRQGMKDEKKRTAVCKMFQCQPDKVISLSTTDREYFLIGEEIKDIEEWLAAISSAWEETKREEKSEQVKTGETVQTTGWPVQDTSFNKEKKRPPSDPLPRTPPHPDAFHLGNRMRPRSDPLPELPAMHNVPIPEMSHLQTLENTYSPQEMGEESIYDVPRKYQNLECEEPVEGDDLPESGNETQESGDEKDSQHYYMKMNSFSSADKNNQKVSRRKCVRADDWRSQVMSNHSWISNEPKSDKKWNELSDVKLKILLSEHVDQSQFERRNIDLSKEDIKYLTLTEIGNRVCVSNWQGPSCIFNYGDRITSINDLGIQSKADVYEDIDRALKENVTLSILRIPNSKVFHSEKCLCSHHHHH